MKNLETRPWNPAEHLETEEDMVVYLEVALEDGDPALVAAAMEDIARADEQILNRLKGSVLKYDQPEKPVSLEGWEIIP